MVNPRRFPFPCRCCIDAGAGATCSREPHTSSYKCDRCRSLNIRCLPQPQHEREPSPPPPPRPNVIAGTPAPHGGVFLGWYNEPQQEQPTAEDQHSTAGTSSYVPSEEEEETDNEVAVDSDEEEEEEVREVELGTEDLVPLLEKLRRHQAMLDCLENTSASRMLRVSFQEVKDEIQRLTGVSL